MNLWAGPVEAVVRRSLPARVALGSHVPPSLYKDHVAAVHLRRVHPGDPVGDVALRGGWRSEFLLIKLVLLAKKPLVGERMKFFTAAAARCASSLFIIWVLAAPVNAADPHSLLFSPQPTAERGPWSVGIYGGELYKAPFVSIFYAPQNIRLSPSYLLALNFDYRFYKFSSLPLQFEGEFNIAKRFGGQDQWDFSAAPFLRWTWFPWNNVLYTNARIGLMGASYVTSISPWERQNSGNATGSNILHFLVPEVTFALSENSAGEAFVRVHHRSGVYGLFNGVKGGSNYLAGGYRTFW